MDTGRLLQLQGTFEDNKALRAALRNLVAACATKNKTHPPDGVVSEYYQALAAARKVLGEGE